jgi:hypothetical protein
MIAMQSAFSWELYSRCPHMYTCIHDYIYIMCNTCHVSPFLTQRFREETSGEGEAYVVYTIVYMCVRIMCAPLDAN